MIHSYIYSKKEGKRKKVGKGGGREGAIIIEILFIALRKGDNPFYSDNSP